MIDAYDKFVDDAPSKRVRVCCQDVALTLVVVVHLRGLIFITN